MNYPSDEELLAYADEVLISDQSALVEQQLREDETLRSRLTELLEKRDQGNLSLGDLWRHHRLSCPSQTELGLFLVGANKPELADYIRFHIEVVGCVYCQAQLSEMRETTRVNQADLQQKRRDTLFASSAGLLKSQRGASPRE